MAIPDKNTEVHTFDGNVDSDTSGDLIEHNKAAFMQNVSVTIAGKKRVLTNILGNTAIANPLPAGNNTAIGYGKNEEKGKLYYFNYNDQGYHGIYVYDSLTRSVTPVIRNLIDTNNIDILKFSPDFLINHVDVIQDNLIYWVDALNKARKANIKKCIDKSAAGYGTVITEDFITAYKQCGVYAPTVVYFTDLTRNSNYLYGSQYKFAYRYYYDDGEISNWGDWSAVALPPNESFLGVTAITFDNNGIKVSIETGSKLVTKIEIGVKINSLDFQGCAILNKSELNIADYSSYDYLFYNDGSYWPLDQAKVSRAYSYLPRVPGAQSFVNVAMTYSRFMEGFPYVKVDGSVDIDFADFYLPSGTVSQLNNPAFTSDQTHIDKHGGLFNTWWTTVTHFLVGSDVKKGNSFNISYTGGNVTDSSAVGTFNVTAGIGDTASTIASKIKAYLRTVDAVGVGSILHESIDGSGNVSWDFTVEAHEGHPPIKFFTNVNPVNYSTLLDNGLSINTIKQGSTRKYAVVYEDDDGRTSLGYTCDPLFIRTPFETETILGQSQPLGLKQPIHKISLFHQPPVWAKYWRLVRTADITDFIQMLIQQVITVTVANQDTYLDLVVGSLFTYQKIHPETILKYEFQRGDRLRLISNLSGPTPVMYTPFFETEVLNYTVNTEEFVSANIVTDGTAEVTPGKAVDPGYIGKNIIINGIERAIVGINGSKYVLDEPINANGLGAPISATVPNYTFIDRRGILRIKKPTGYTIVDFSKIELYHPQKNANIDDFQTFFDFQMKFNVLNWGQPTRSHAGNAQNQDGTNSGTLASTPAIIQVTEGDCYVRNRALPSSNANPNPQVVIDRIADPNFSDFYQSNLYSTGRVFPQDRGYGEVFFGSRVRFSNNYIEDTQINGLNDYNNTDRVDYNDPYGDITLTRFKRGYLYLFKQLKLAWTAVGAKIIRDNDDAELLSTSDKLLNDLSYAVWDGGIGNNGESWCENGNSMYYASANSGVFLRVAQDGSIPISQLYFYDKRAKEILAEVSKYNLRIFGAFYRKRDEALWTVKPYTPYIYNDEITDGGWDATKAAYPEGTVWAVVSQPANSTVTLIDGIFQITDTEVVGPDVFTFQGTMPGGALTPIINFCFNVVEPNPETRATGWRVRPETDYCEKSLLEESWMNDGNQSYKILEEYYLDDDSLTGRIMPNISAITNDVIIPSTSDITVNIEDAIAPTGGSNGDVWYNFDGDALYKKVDGAWSLISGRLINAFYQAGIQNLEACPLPTLYQNVEKSGEADKEGCATHYHGSTETYIVPAGTYHSYVSQEIADDLAQADVDANKQAYANSHGTCIQDDHWYNVEIDSDYQRDNCGPGYEGTTVHINIPPGTYISYISQEDADNQADAAAQDEANTDGSCIAVYESAAINSNYRRNDCGAGQTGTFVYVSLPMGAYTSIVSQIDADNQAQTAAQAQANSEGSCLYDATISTVLVEYLTDTNADLCMFVQTPALDESGIIVTGTALTPSGPLLRPDDGTDPSNCYLLSSDKLGSTSPAWRFGINIAYFVQKYAGVLTSITFRMQGRDTVAGACSIRYAPRPVTEGYLELVGSTGARIPAVSAGSSIPTTVASNITSGANGTVGTGVGSPVFDIIYTFRVGITPDSISVTTY